MHVTEIDCSKTYDFSQKPTHFGAIYQSSCEIVLKQSTSRYCITTTNDITLKQRKFLKINNFQIRVILESLFSQKCQNEIAPIKKKCPSSGV